MGSDPSGKTELDPNALIAADAYICDRVSQGDVSGEKEAVLAAGIWTKGRPAELGEVITGTRAGRQHPQEVTIFDLTGTAVQDTAIATHVCAATRRQERSCERDSLANRQGEAGLHAVDHHHRLEPTDIGVFIKEPPGELFEILHIARRNHQHEI